MVITDFYKAIGADYSEVLERMLNKEELVYRFLKKFVDDPTYSKLEEVINTGDGETIFRVAHTLKGVVSNLELTPLTKTVSSLVEITRTGKNDGIDETFEKIKEEYNKIISLIKEIE